MKTFAYSFTEVATTCLHDDATPWMPLSSKQPDIEIKYFRIDPVRGEFICSLRMQPGVNLPAHHHTGTVIVYTLQGAWKYREHDWIARPGSVVFETAASRHTPETLADAGEVITFNIVSGELLFLDPDGQLIATENWRTAAHRYLKFCERNGMTPRDLSSQGLLVETPTGKPPK
jgi:2,4'-dihydroxyacetophenone dioxygenase